MTTIEIFEPGGCCATSSVVIDQAIVTFNADMDWCKQHGIEVKRHNLLRDPESFLGHPRVREFLESAGSQSLPITLLNGVVALAGRLPNRDEFAAWAVGAAPVEIRPLATSGTPLPIAGATACCPSERQVAAQPIPATSAADHPTLKFLASPPPFLFFTGKGGVGKTSLACAAAVHLADAGKRVLLVSTDPASNVGQVFAQAIGHKVVAINEVQGLWAMEVDPMAAAQAYRNRVLDPVRGAMPDDFVRGIEEQLSGSCTTEIAAFDEFTGLLTNRDLRRDFDHVVFDTAPTGHTLRMLELPGAWSGYLRDNPDAAANLGPLVGLEKKRDQYADAVRALSEPGQTRMVLVARAQRSTLEEVSHTSEDLHAIGIANQYLTINGALSESVAADPLAAAIFAREQEAIAALPDNLAHLPQDRLPLKPFDLMGAAALRSLLDDHAANPSEIVSSAPPASYPSLSRLLEQLSEHGPSLIMTMGKGGVGKTTIAAALAVALVQRGHRVHLSTSDPAAHLSYTLDGTMDKLTVSRIDPKAETERYRTYVLEHQGKGLDAAGRAVLEEDLRSPCTEEIAVFQAFSRIVNEADRQFVVMDTAPTGHTLLLLDATGAYHREMVRQMRSSGGQVVTPMTQLQDPKRTKVIVVTLAETTPVLEAAHLQDDLRRAQIEPWAWVVNNSLAAANPASPLLVARARRELPLIAEVKERQARRFALIPLLPEEPVGITLLGRMVV